MDRPAAKKRASDICAVIDQFADDVESGEIFPNGIVLEPFPEEDSLVQQIDDFTRDDVARKRASQAGRRR